MFRKNSTVRKLFDDAGLALIEHGAKAITRILPHAKVSTWVQDNWDETAAVWDQTNRTRIRVTLGIGRKDDPNSRSIIAFVERKLVAGFVGAAGRALDTREHKICVLIANRISEVAATAPTGTSAASLRAIRHGFDEYVVARYVEEHYGLKLSVASVLEALHKLAEQSYENKSITFGCLLDADDHGTPNGATFPDEFLSAKKYKALSDGFRTAYRVSTDGKVVDFLDLEQSKVATGTHYFPEWAEALARASHSGRCGIALSRQGDILVFDAGTLRFTYRYGRWQYWSHTHLVRLLGDAARTQRVPVAIRGNVVGAVYRGALDISFRRSGGLFVILRRRSDLREIVRVGDAIGDARRAPIDLEFDAVLKDRRF